MRVRTLVAALVSLAACSNGYDEGPGFGDMHRFDVETSGSDETSAPSDTSVDSTEVDDTIAADTITDDTITDDTLADDTTADDTTAIDSTAATDIGPSDSDDIYGVMVPRASSWWVADGLIHHGADVVTLHGLNWFGLETPDHALHGTWTGRTVLSFVQQMKTLGFDALRIPVSPETVRAGFAAASWSSNAYSVAAPTGREQLERLLDVADAEGLHVLIDFHTCSPYQIGGSLPGSPDNCGGRTIADWHDDLQALAHLAEAHASVLGIDLLNEPHALTWSAWMALVDVAGRKVLAANPSILVFVEGVGNDSNTGAWPVYWGENLTDAGAAPIDLPASRLVYAPHVYGPSVSAMGYYTSGDYPANLPGVWDAHFGHMVARGAAIVIGELGGKFESQVEQQWGNSLVDYLGGWPMPAFFYWALNPNSGDTGGILADDWQTPIQAKLDLLAPLMGSR